MASRSDSLKWATVSLKTLFSTNLKDFPKIKHKNVEYFNLVHAHKPIFLPLPVSNFFLALLLSFFSLVLLLLPFAFHIFSGCAKKLGVY